MATVTQRIDMGLLLRIQNLELEVSILKMENERLCHQVMLQAKIINTGRNRLQAYKQINTHKL